MSPASSQRGLDAAASRRGSAARPRAVPPDWALALRAGLETALGGWLVVLIPVVAVYLATSSMDAAAALSLGRAVETATGLWGLGLGGSYGRASGADGVLSLPLLGLTCLEIGLARSALRRARLSGPVAGAWAVAAAGGMAVLIVSATGPEHSRTWPAVAGLVLVVAACCLIDLQRRGRGPQRLSAWWSRRPSWADPALGLARWTGLTLAVLALAVLAVAAVQGAGRVSRLHDALSAGGLVSSAGLVALQAGWLPNLVVWAVSWLAGAGFVVGTGSIFLPDRVTAGPVPALPLLGLLPTAPVGGEGSSLGLYAPLVVTAAAVAVAWVRRRSLTGLPLGQAATAALVASAAVAGGTGLACAAASGSAGPGRMSQVGPNIAAAIGLVLLEVGVGMVAAVVATHPWTAVAAERGVRSTTRRAGAAVEQAREMIGRSRQHGGGHEDDEDMSDDDTITDQARKDPHDE